MKKTLHTILLAVLMLTASLWQATPASAATTSFKFLHAAPDGAAYDFYLDDAKMTTLAFTQFSSDVSASVATHQIRVFPAGTTATPVLAFTVPFGAYHKYTVVVAGRQATGLRPVVLTEVPTPVRRYFRIRVVNLDPDQPQPIELINISNRLIIPNVAFTANKYATLPSGAGSYHFLVRVVGNPTPFVDLPPATFESRKSYTLWVYKTSLAANAAAVQRALPEMNLPNVKQFQPNVFTLTQD